MRRRYKPRPPKRHCRECGTDVYSWTESPLCTTCVRAVEPIGAGESLRDFRKRVLDPERNTPTGVAWPFMDDEGRLKAP